MNARFHRWFIALFSCASMYHVYGYSTGANTIVCNTAEMKPAHTPDVGFISTGSNFAVEVKEDEYTPGGKSLLVTISGDGQTFRGFLIQARKNNSFDPLAKGTIGGPQTLTAPICGTTGHGRTHTDVFSSSSHRTVSLPWHPPSICEAAEVGDIVFQATVVTGFNQPPHINLFSKVVKMKPATITTEMLKEAGCLPSAGNSAMQTTWSTYLLVLAAVARALKAMI